MNDKEVSNLGVTFCYDSVENILIVSLQKEHVLPRMEAERIWRVVKTYAASHPARPVIVLEAGNKRLEYGSVEISAYHYLFDETCAERRCLAMLTHNLNSARLSLILN